MKIKIPYLEGISSIHIVLYEYSVNETNQSYCLRTLFGTYTDTYIIYKNSYNKRIRISSIVGKDSTISAHYIPINTPSLLFSLTQLMKI